MDPLAVSYAFLDDMGAARFAEAAALFDDQVRVTIPVASLKDTWRRAEVKFGKVVGRTEKRRYRHQHWDIVEVSVEFSRGSVVFSFWVHDGRISGFGAVE